MSMVLVVEKVSFYHPLVKRSNVGDTAVAPRGLAEGRGQGDVQLQLQAPGAQPQSAQVHPEFPQPPFMLTIVWRG